MQRTVYCLFVCLVLGLTAFCAGVHGEEHLWEGFGGLDQGRIDVVPGWEASGTLIPLRQPGQVTNSMPFYGEHALCLFAPIGTAWSTRGVYTNFTYTWNGTNNPVISVSLWLYRGNTNQTVDVLLDTDGDGKLKVTLGTNGTIACNGTDSGVRYQTGVYRRLVFSYDAADNRNTVFYDGTSVVNWTDAGGTVATQFNRFAVQRQASGDGPGEVFVDEIWIMNAAPHTWAWWRFDDWDYEKLDWSRPSPLGEVLQHFAPDQAGYDDFHPTEPRGLWVHDQEGDAHNRHAYRHAIYSASPNLIHSPIFTNWTIETIVRLRSGPGNRTFFTWGRPGPAQSTKSWISFGIQVDNQFTFSLRDMRELSDDYNYITDLGELPDDGRWHHVAAVKDGVHLTTYVDYHPADTINLSSLVPEVASRDYFFDTNTLSRCALGVSLNIGTPFAANDECDEVRFSTHALQPREFLQYADPVFTGLPVRYSPTVWRLTMTTIPEWSYQYDECTDPASGTWTHPITYERTATGFSTSVSVSAPTNSCTIYRARRTEPPFL